MTKYEQAPRPVPASHPRDIETIIDCGKRRTKAVGAVPASV